MAVDRVKADRPEKGKALVNYEEKLYPDHKAKAGEKALFLIHSVPYEGSVAGINMLTAIRTKKKGYDVTVLFYGPASGIPVYRGWPNVGDDGYGAGIQLYPNLVNRMLSEGIKVLACRFSAAALLGQNESSFIEGVVPIHPTDILDIVIEHHRAGAMIFNTWTV
ncbi:MAG TPA: MSMEG_0572/Sll0783 family nitrogen starvation response protein [Thermodesulfobacteriota bacterium]|nr:MSMEG_0572/Sll0783 family nitrogen starvation response protein [Thermodesulfobacteriota bacterium]